MQEKVCREKRRAKERDRENTGGYKMISIATNCRLVRWAGKVTRDHQYGFRQGRSASDLIYSLKTTVMSICESTIYKFQGVKLSKKWQGISDL